MGSINKLQFSHTSSKQAQSGTAPVPSYCNALTHKLFEAALVVVEPEKTDRGVEMSSRDSLVKSRSI